MVPNLLPLPAAAPALPGKGSDAVSATGAMSFADLLTLDPAQAPAEAPAAAQAPAQAMPVRQTQTPDPADLPQSVAAPSPGRATVGKSKDTTNEKDDTPQALAPPDAALLALVMPMPARQTATQATAPAAPPTAAPAAATTPPRPPEPAAPPTTPPAQDALAGASDLPVPATTDAKAAAPRPTAKSDTKTLAKVFADLGKSRLADATQQPDAKPIKAVQADAAIPAAKTAPENAADPAPVVETATEPAMTPAFSMQPADNTAASTYGPSAAPDAPPSTSLSQAAVATLSDLGLQIGKRLKDGNTKFDIELHPADLGKVEVALTIARNGKVSAHLSFDSPVTATAFHARESELRQQLAQAGLDVAGDALSFSSRDSGTGSNASPQQDRPAPPPRALRALADAGRAADDTDLDTLLSTFRRPASRLALDLLV